MSTSNQEEDAFPATQAEPLRGGGLTADRVLDRLDGDDRGAQLFVKVGKVLRRHLPSPKQGKADGHCFFQE